MYRLFQFDNTSGLSAGDYQPHQQHQYPHPHHTTGPGHPHVPHHQSIHAFLGSAAAAAATGNHFVTAAAAAAATEKSSMPIS